MSKEEHAEIVKRQCKEQKRGDWAKKKTWYDKALALGFFTRDRKDVRSILEEAEAKGEYLPLLDNEVAFGELADEFERQLLPSYLQSKNLEAEGLKGVLRERSEAEEEIFHSEDNLISTKKLFQSLIKQVGHENSWIEEKDLSLYLKFAIKRPLMSEFQFCRALEMLDLTLDFRRAGVMSATDKGPAGLASGKSEEDGAEQFGETRQLLMNVYEIFQDGMIHLEEAHRHYREILGYTDVDRETLIASLQNYGIPIEQTPSSCQPSSRDAAIKNYPGTRAATLTRSLKQELPIDKGSMEIIEELSNSIKLYRCRHVTLTEALNLIYESLEPYKPKKGVVKDYVKGSSDPDAAAYSLWEEAAEEDNDDQDDDDDDNDDDDSNDNDGEDDDNADASNGVEDSKPAHIGQGHPKTHLTESQALDGHDYENDLEHPDGTSTVQGSHMGPSASLLPGPQSPARDTGKRGRRQDTPILEAIAPATGVSKSRSQLSKTSRKGRLSPVAVSSSRDPILYVQTGSYMPSKQARRVAYDLGLPYDYLRHRVRERSIRVERKRAKRARLLGPSTKSKRKASNVVGQSSPRRSPRLRLFVKPRDPKRDPGRSALEHRDVTKSTTPCPTCSHRPCYCAAEPQGPVDLDPRCRKCQQEPCTCVESFRSPERDQKAGAEGSNHSAHMDFNDIGQYSGSPYPVLAYLSHIWEAQYIFQSFIRAGFGNTTEAMRKSAYRILAEIGLGIKLGEINGCITEKDVAAVAVLNCLQGGSHPLEEAPSFSTKKISSKSSRPVRAPKATQSGQHSTHIKSSSSGPHQDPNLVMSHLISSTNDPFILPRLDKVVTSANISGPEIMWMKTLLDSVPKQMPHGAIKGRFSEQDITVISKMQKIVETYSSTVLQHAKDNAPPGGIDSIPVPPIFYESNPVLAYLTRVLEHQSSEDSTLEFLRNLERNPMSKSTMVEIERIVGLVTKGFNTRVIGRGPQAWKDIAACGILDRLYEKCTPLHDWGRYVNTSTAAGPAREYSTGPGNLEEPKDSNSSSGAPAQGLDRDQHSSLSSDIARGMKGESLDTNMEVESLEGSVSSVKLTPSRNASWFPTNESLQSSGVPEISEARHSELDGAEDSSAPPLTPWSGSYGIPRSASPAAESSRQSPASPSSPWTTPHELFIPGNPVAESAFESPKPPPSPRPTAKELTSPINPVAGSSLRGPEPPASPRPRSKELPRFVNATAEPWLKIPEPPPAPQLKAKELSRPVVPISKSPLQDPERENLPLKERREQPPTSDMFRDMTAEESFEYFQDVAFREQRSFSAVMAERRAIRKRPGEADYRCFPSFFQSSNGGAPNLAATLSKLFDKYRGNLSMPKFILNIVLNSVRQSERRIRQDRC